MISSISNPYSCSSLGLIFWNHFGKRTCCRTCWCNKYWRQGTRNKQNQLGNKFPSCAYIAVGRCHWQGCTGIGILYNHNRKGRKGHSSVFVCSFFSKKQLLFSCHSARVYALRRTASFMPSHYVKHPIRRETYPLNRLHTVSNDN